MIALIMAGGIGSRFWPLSRKSRPKQFLNIVSDKSMIELTVDRLKPLIDIKDVYVVTSGNQKRLVLESLPTLPPENVIVEPFGMNTAPCIALSNLYLMKKYDKNETVVVLPSDHLIQDEEKFRNYLKLAEKGAKQDNLVTFGIKPDYPATGYGYIEADSLLSNEIYKVKKFKEKPDLKTAESFLKKGNYFWNSGMFIWKLDTITKIYAQYQPEMMQLIDEISKIWNTGSDDIATIYKKMPKLPVDIAIMEKAEKKAVIPVEFGWSDVGSWEALYDILDKDENGNILKTENITLSSKNNLVMSKKFVSMIGINNVALIETDNAILLVDINKTQDVKKIVDILKAEKRDDLL